MATKSTAKKRPSGAEQLKKAGKRQLLVGVPNADMDLIAAAAAADRRSNANFFEVYGLPAMLEAAKRILEKSQK